MANFYSSFIKKDDLCFDIGANVGNYTDVFLRLGATVVAVEPQDHSMGELRRKYRNNKRVILIHKGLDNKVGEQELVICSAHPASSMSKDWISAVKHSGRFPQMSSWDKTKVVPVTTLDMLIEDYGRPTFCKIDVEGYEFNVLQGLSYPIPYISFEFTPEFLDPAKDCIEYLATLGTAVFNYSIGQSMKLALSDWVEPKEMYEILEQLPDKSIFGDIYAKFIE
jgi:FkbM family methyltransferase